MPHKNREVRLAYMREYNKKWYKKNKKSHAKNTKENKEKIKVAFYKYKSTLRCSVCSENNIACLVFHHREGEKKERDIAVIFANRCSMDTIKKEIKKCDILCANSHRKLHWEKKKMTDPLLRYI